MKAAAGLRTSKRHWDESSLIFLPESCFLDECPHFIRCADVKSMKEKCNKHLKESQEWRHIDLARFQCNCPVAHSDTATSWASWEKSKHLKGHFVNVDVYMWLSNRECVQKMHPKKKLLLCKIIKCVISCAGFPQERPTWRHKSRTLTLMGLVSCFIWVSNRDDLNWPSFTLHKMLLKSRLRHMELHEKRKPQSDIVYRSFVVSVLAHSDFCLAHEPSYDGFIKPSENCDLN